MAADHAVASEPQDQGNDGEPLGLAVKSRGGEPGLVPIREATPISRPPPPYPEPARKRGLEGTVVLDVLVTSGGGVGGVLLFSSSGHPILDRAATAAVQEWSFAPAMKGKTAVEMWMRIPVRFALQ